MDEQKICGRPGCGKKLTPANRSGFCAAHFYDSKRKSGNAIAGGRRMSRETKPAKRETKHPAGETHRAITENTAASLLVSEAQINRMFLNWPLEDKVLAVQAFLDREG